MKNSIIATIILASAVLSTASANQNTLETWECREFSLAAVLSEQPMTVKATSNSALEKGTVAISGLKYNSKYEVQGFIRIWRIKHDETYDILVIGPNHIGELYLNLHSEDLEKDTDELSSLNLSCKQIK